MMKNIFLLLILSVLFVGCGSNSKRPPVDLSHAKSDKIVKISYEQRGGVKVIPVKLNGVTMDMIYDTGCSGIHLSLLELQQLVKQGCFSEQDVLGTGYSCIADGSIVENGVIRLHSVEIAPGLVLNNVQATVALNQEAPLLLGDEVLDNIASKIEVDNLEGTINFTKW